MLLLLVLSPRQALPQTADESVRVSVEYGSSVTLSVREDVRLRRNGAYQGLRYRERYGVLRRKPDDTYAGRLLTLEDTLRGTVRAAKRVERGERVVVSLPRDGGVTVPSGQVLPRLRHVPSFPDRELRVGDEWSNPGLWIADPSGNESPFVALIAVAYRYRGVDTYQGDTVHVFDGGYRLRYPREIPDELAPLVAATGLPVDSPHVSRAEGSHRLTVLVSADGSRVLLVRDVFTSVFTLTDGTELREEGFSLMFWRTSAPVDDVAQIEEEVEAIPETTVDRVEEGVRITLGNLRFQPDSAQMLPGESARLAAIADVLSRHPDRSILVVGHTADVGRPEGQRRLSVARARAVVDGLVTAGLRSSRLLYEGRGAGEPVAPNDTEAGRAQNRRVEVILLDDQL